MGLDNTEPMVIFEILVIYINLLIFIICKNGLNTNL